MFDIFKQNLYLDCVQSETKKKYMFFFCKKQIYLSTETIQQTKQPPSHHQPLVMDSTWDFKIQSKTETDKKLKYKKNIISFSFYIENNEHNNSN